MDTCCAKGTPCACAPVDLADVEQHQFVKAQFRKGETSPTGTVFQCIACKTSLRLLMRGQVEAGALVTDLEELDAVSLGEQYEVFGDLMCADVDGGCCK